MWNGEEDPSSFILTSFLPAFLLPSFHLNLLSSSHLVQPYSLKPEISPPSSPR